MYALACDHMMQILWLDTDTASLAARLTSTEKTQPVNYYVQFGALRHERAGLRGSAAVACPAILSQCAVKSERAS